MITVLISANAAAFFPHPLILYPSTQFHGFSSQDMFHECLVGKSANKWITSNPFAGWLKKVFIPQTSHLKKPVLLLVDNHKSHQSLRVSKLCSQSEWDHPEWFTGPRIPSHSAPWLQTILTPYGLLERGSSASCRGRSCYKEVLCERFQGSILIIWKYQHDQNYPRFCFDPTSSTASDPISSNMSDCINSTTSDPILLDCTSGDLLNFVSSTSNPINLVVIRKCSEIANADIAAWWRYNNVLSSPYWWVLQNQRSQHCLWPMEGLLRRSWEWEGKEFHTLQGSSQKEIPWQSQPSTRARREDILKKCQIV